jgi:hypothetical protein
VKVPPHAAGRVVIAVSNAWGTAQRTLTYVGAPQIVSLSPSSGPPSGGTTVTVHGTSLREARRVTIDGKAVDFHVLGPRRLTLTTPAHAAGAVPVTVSSPFGISNTARFTFATASPSPSPTSSSPTSTGVAVRAAPRGATRAGTAAWHRELSPASYPDRIGDGWFLVGRLFATNLPTYLHGCRNPDVLRRALVLGQLDCEAR